MVKVLMKDKRHLDAGKVIPMLIDGVWKLHLYQIWNKEMPILEVLMEDVLQITG